MRAAASLAALIAVAFMGSGCSSLYGRQGPVCAWTAQYTNCGYYSLESCRAGLSASGAGICGLNPEYPGEKRKRAR